MKIHNFSSGPSILPQSVFQEAAEAVKDFNGKGLSILEVSHRGDDFTAVLEESHSLVKELLGLNDEFEVIFLSGGATSQFFMVAMNLLNDYEKAYFVDTGTWSQKAIKETINFGKTEILASSADKQYTYIPKDITVPNDGKYLHITSNNTIYGAQYKSYPAADIPLVVDMSSDIMNTPLGDLNKYGVIYAGAQKNIGPAGVTLVIVKKDLLGKVERSIPLMLDYRNHIKKLSAFNTPPVFPIYVSMLNMRWVKANGGIDTMHKHSQAKAKLLYDELDRNGCFSANVVKGDRSIMNATFSAKDDATAKAFLKACEEANISSIKGHRSVGGFRASMYNAMDISSVEVLVDVLKNIENKMG